MYKKIIFVFYLIASSPLFCIPPISQAQDYFYHGCSTDQYVNFLLNTYLDAYTNNRRLVPHFLKLRHDDDLFKGAISAYTYLKNNYHHIDDHEKQHRNHLIAASLSLPGNARTAVGLEDATDFVFRNRSIHDIAPSNIISKYCKHDDDRNRTNGIRNETTQHLLAQHTYEFQKYIDANTKRGVLLRINIPRYYSTRLAYLSFPFGRPICFYATQTHSAHQQMKQFLNTYRHNTIQALDDHCTRSYDDIIKTLKKLQTRILLHHNVFSTPGIINIQAYHGIPKEDLKAYENNVKAIISQYENNNASHFFNSSLFPETSEEHSEFRKLSPKADATQASFSFCSYIKKLFGYT